MSFISRGNTYIKLNIQENESVSEPFNMENFAGGTLLYFGNNWSEANIGFLVSYDKSENFVTLRDRESNIIQIIVPEGSFAVNLPEELFSCFFVKIWSKSVVETAEESANQTSKQAFVITLKG